MSGAPIGSGDPNDPWYGRFALRSQDSWGELARAVVGYTAFLVVPALVATALVYVVASILGQASISVPGMSPTVAGVSGGAITLVGTVLRLLWRRRGRRGR